MKCKVILKWLTSINKLLMYQCDFDKNLSLHTLEQLAQLYIEKLPQFVNGQELFSTFVDNVQSVLNSSTRKKSGSDSDNSTYGEENVLASQTFYFGEIQVKTLEALGGFSSGFGFSFSHTPSEENPGQSKWIQFIRRSVAIDGVTIQASEGYYKMNSWKLDVKGGRQTPYFTDTNKSTDKDSRNPPTFDRPGRWRSDFPPRVGAFSTEVNCQLISNIEFVGYLVDIVTKDVLAKATINFNWEFEGDPTQMSDFTLDDLSISNANITHQTGFDLDHIQLLKGYKF